MHVGMLGLKLNNTQRSTYLVCISLAELRLSPVLQEVASPLTGQALKCSLQQANSGAVNQRLAWVCCLLS